MPPLPGLGAGLGDGLGDGPCWPELSGRALAGGAAVPYPSQFCGVPQVTASTQTSIRAAAWAEERTMKAEIHPEYRPVVFRDRSAEFSFLTRSTAKPRDTIEWEDGNTYPVVDIEVSAASHPFYTGKAHMIDAAGRIEQFHRKFGKR